jgi:hypothetical protein
VIIFDVPLWQVLTLLAATILPLLVGLVTTRETNPVRKATYLAALSVLTNLATELAHALQSGTEYNLGLALLLGLGTFLVGVGTHFGLWKPTGIASKLQDLGTN